MHRPFTQDWADAFRDAINADAAYRAAAASWTWPLALAMEARPDLGYPEAVAVELALDRGTCHDARIVPADAATAPYVLRGSYDTWKRVVRGDVDAVMAVATGQLALARGSLMTLMMHTGSAKALVATAGTVPTTFPDEMTA